MDAADERKAKRLAWQTGRLEYKLRPIQRRMKEHWQTRRGKNVDEIWEAARRTGKSTLLLVTMTEQCLRKPRYRCCFFAPVRDGLLDYISPIIDQVYEDCPDDLRPDFNPGRFLLTFPNGATILFRGSNNQQHRTRRGLDIQLGGIDEARDVDELAALIDSVIMPALFSRQGNLIISSTEPDTPNHHFCTLVDDAKIHNRLWFSTILDCEYDEAWINRWAAEYDKSTHNPEVGRQTIAWRREMMCERVVDPTRAVIPEWGHREGEEIKQDDFYQYYKHYVGIDWGFKDYTALVFATYWFKDAILYFEDELTYSGREVRSDKVAQSMLLKEKKLWRGLAFRRISDNSDPILINELNGHPDVSVIPVLKDSLEAMVNEFRIKVAQGKIRVGPRCKYLLGCLQNATWDKDRKEWESSAAFRHFDHLAAAIYLSRHVDEFYNPIPSGLGMSAATHNLPPDIILGRQENPALKVLGEIFKNGRPSQGSTGQDRRGR